MEGELALNVPAGPVGSSSQHALKNPNIHARLVPVGRMLPYFLVTALFFLWPFQTT